jgi:hypothetical protein
MLDSIRGTSRAMFGEKPASRHAHPALDTSCAAQAQCAHRLERGMAYERYMRMRHPAGLRHRTIVIDGIGHDGTGIFTSPQGVAAVFDDNATR